MTGLPSGSFWNSAGRYSRGVPAPAVWNELPGAVALELRAIRMSLSARLAIGAAVVLVALLCAAAALDWLRSTSFITPVFGGLVVFGTVAALPIIALYAWLLPKRTQRYFVRLSPESLSVLWEGGGEEFALGEVRELVIRPEGDNARLVIRGRAASLSLLAGSSRTVPAGPNRYLIPTLPEVGETWLSAQGLVPQTSRSSLRRYRRAD